MPFESFKLQLARQLDAMDAPFSRVSSSPACDESLDALTAQLVYANMALVAGLDEYGTTRLEELQPIVAKIDRFFATLSRIALKHGDYYRLLSCLEQMKSRRLSNVLTRNRFRGTAIGQAALAASADQRMISAWVEFNEVYLQRCLSGPLKTAIVVFFRQASELHALVVHDERSPTFKVFTFSGVAPNDLLTSEFTRAITEYSPSMDDAVDNALQPLIGGVTQLSTHLRHHEVKKVVIVPHRETHLVPMHLVPVGSGLRLWDIVDELTYCPSLTLYLELFRERSFNQNTVGAFDVSRLHFGTVALFHTLRFARGTPKVFLDNFDPSLLDNDFGLSCHFDCHGMAERVLYENSHLRLGTRNVTFAEILEKWDLNGTWLAVLSACDTGLSWNTDDLRDEYVGMDGAFLGSGAATTVSTFWGVDERSTVLALAKFYELIRDSNSSPAQALKHACIWLRNGDWKDDFAAMHSQSELMAIARHLPDALAKRMTIEVAQLARLVNDAPRDFFSSVFHWGAFKCSGYGSSEIALVGERISRS